jgi:hypothetical protein
MTVHFGQLGIRQSGLAESEKKRRKIPRRTSGGSEMRRIREIELSQCTFLISSVICIGIVYHILLNVPAWIQGGRSGGGSDFFIEVKESDLSRFPHLLEAFMEDAEARSQHRAHASHMTWCPRNEALQIIQFLGGEYPQVGNSYGDSIQLENGTKYSFGIVFRWEPPLIQ